MGFIIARKGITKREFMRIKIRRSKKMGDIFLMVVVIMLIHIIERSGEMVKRLER